MAEAPGRPKALRAPNPTSTTRADAAPVGIGSNSVSPTLPAKSPRAWSLLIKPPVCASICRAAALKSPFS